MPNQKPNTAFPISLGIFARYQNNTSNPHHYAEGIQPGKRNEQLTRSDSSSNLSSLNGNEPKILAGEAENKREQHTMDSNGLKIGIYRTLENHESN